MKRQSSILAAFILLIAGCFRCIHGFNQPPIVSFLPSLLFPSEDLPAGSHLFNITATDSDGPNAPTFRAFGEATNTLVTVLNVSPGPTSTWTVGVILKGRLDRDREQQTRTLLFEISDGTTNITYSVNLIISDVNDNPPAFENEPYRIELYEGDENVSQIIFTVLAKDPDNGPGGSPVYSMIANAQSADNNTFRILNENNGSIILTRALDYETKNYYQYQILSRDRGYPSCPGTGCKCNNFTEPKVNCDGNPASFVVVVLDVQDTPPFFERLPYMATVLENVAVGTSFYQVSAQDGDRGVPNAIQYSIVNETQYPFAINATTGEITTKSDLNTDGPNGTSRYTITIMASEVIKPNQTQRGETNSTTEMSITITDINDNTPSFKQKVYYATVDENTPRRVPLDLNVSIEVEDIDQNANSLFKVLVEQSGQPYPMFETIPRGEIQGSAAITVTVNNSKILDYETTHNITFQLVAQEVATHENRNSTATLILSILDVNDNSPYFTSGMTSVNVTENTANVTLGQYEAKDADSGPFGTVRYSLDSNYSSAFAIDTDNGTLRLLLPLDREVKESYSLVVIATDNNDADPEDRRSTQYNVRIAILDANDNSPKFTNLFGQASVQENASPGTALMTLTATDHDTGDNAEVVFEILNIVSASVPDLNCSNFFAISRTTGVLAVSAETKANNDSLLIDNAGSYNVTIAAYDSPHNSADRLNDTTWVLVTVIDVNIHAPVFVKPDQFLYNATTGSIPNITVKEEIPIGSVIMVLNATDADGGENGIVYYELNPDVNQHFTYFDVDYVAGSLFTKKRLNREEISSFQVNLKAVDRGRPRPLSTTVPFQIVLEDIDDSPPEFPRNYDLKLSVGEETQNVSVGYVNISTDADSNPQHRINCYYLYGGAQASDFQLNKATGELRLNAKLDRDQTSSVTLLVKASGNCSFPEDHFISNGNNSFNSSDNSLLQVVITVDDINDNGPVFDKDALTVGLLFDTEIGFQVINLVAFTTDNDTAANRRNFYKLLQLKSDPGWGSGLDPFSVHVNGSVVTTTLFSAVDSLVFTLNIMTYDNNNQNDTADLVIYLVSSLVRIKLVFNKQPQEVAALKGEFIRKLGAALGFTVVADKIATHVTTSNTADPTKTDMFIHARYIPSGKIVPPEKLISKFDYDQAVRDIFREMGVAESAPVVMAETQKDNKDLEKSFIIVAVVLAIVVVVLAMVLFNTVRRYRRRLRAATTSAYVTTKEDMSNNYVPPGTNRYFAAENPLFGKDVKPVDMNKNGDNDSLDDNAVDLTKVGGKEREEEQEMYLDMYDEGHRGPGSQLNHLQMVLQEYEKGGSEGYDELSTTQSYLASSLQDGQEWKSLSGHAKADSGFNEHDLDHHPYNDHERLQYSDI